MRNTSYQPHGTNLPVAEFLKQPEQWKNSVLGALCFYAAPIGNPLHADLGLPCLRVPMQRLDGIDSSCEVWHGSGNLISGQCGDIHYRHDEGVLFGAIELSESLFSAQADSTPLQQATESAYRQIFALLDSLKFPHLFRCWNYIADINSHSFGLERYRQFNRGRQDAFHAHGRDVPAHVPAACALGFAPQGSTPGPLVIAFLAGRVAPLNIENPRQISAYQYPQQYGPRSPTFSRASLVRMGQDEVLFVSGTASVVGHATLHADDVVAQTRETMTNIEVVLGEANRLTAQRFDLGTMDYRIYVRHPADLALIRAEFSRCVGGEPKAVYLQADVCREDLLMEIEATATLVTGERG